MPHTAGAPGHASSVFGRCVTYHVGVSNDNVDARSQAMSRFFAVIPAGGVGTRLWPLSRAAAPKFLHDLTGSGSTLIRATYDRLEPLAEGRVLVVTGDAHRAAVCRQLPELSDRDLVLESEPKDSAAAIGLAAAILHERDPETIMGSFAADQVISPTHVFQAAVREAIRGGFASSRVLDVHGQRMLERNFMPGGQVKTQLKDQRNILAAASAAGVTLPVTELVTRQYETIAGDIPSADHAAGLIALERMNPGKRLGTADDNLP